MNCHDQVQNGLIGMEGLRDTLVDLQQYLDAPRQPAVKNAIDTINKALMNDSPYVTGVGRAQ